MKTTYYFTKNNAYNEIIAVKGDRFYCCPVDGKGNDELTGVNLYDNDTNETITALKTAFENLIAENIVYNMDDIERDFPDNIFEFHATEYETLIPIAEIK